MSQLSQESHERIARASAALNRLLDGDSRLSLHSVQDLEGLSEILPDILGSLSQEQFLDEEEKAPFSLESAGSLSQEHFLEEEEEAPFDTKGEPLKGVGETGVRIAVDDRQEIGYSDKELKYLPLPELPEHTETSPARDQAELETVQAEALALMERIEELGSRALPIVIQLIRNMIERVLDSYDEETVIKELESRGIPKWDERHELPPGERTDDLEEWLRRYYADYLAYYGAPVDRLFQFQLGKYDPPLLEALRTDVKRSKLTVRRLTEIIGTKSDHLKALKEIFPRSLWELFKRLWTAEQRKAARHRAKSR